MQISELQNLVKELLVEKGFGYGKETFWEKLALTHTEVSELADVIKKQGFDSIEEIEGEVADIIIRAVNFAVMFNFDLESAISKKMSANFNRPYLYNTAHEQLELEFQESIATTLEGSPDMNDPSHVRLVQEFQLDQYAQELVGKDAE